MAFCNDGAGPSSGSLVCPKCKNARPLESFRGTRGGQVRDCASCRAIYRREQNARYNRDPVHRLRITRASATKRGYVFQLNDEEAFAFFERPCFYCDYKDAGGALNNIDRFDNDVGYVFDNCVTACCMCNLTKKCLDGVTFVWRCMHIAGMVEAPDAWPSTDRGSSFSQTRRNAENANREFSLTREQFDALVSRPCTYCRRRSTSERPHGIDRIDCAVGYTLENSLSCCSECNIMRKENDRDAFVNKCREIANVWIGRTDELPIAAPNLKSIVKLATTVTVRHLKTRKAVLQIDPKTGTPVAIFDSVDIAAEEVDVTSTSISRCLSTAQITAGGWRWALAKGAPPEVVDALLAARAGQDAPAAAVDGDVKEILE